MATRINVEMLKATVVAWNDDKAPRLAAAIAYATIFAIAPLVIITIALVGAALGFTGSAHPQTAVENTLLAQIGNAAGPGAAQMVHTMVDAAFGRPQQNVFAQIAGWIAFIIGASGLFLALQDALNAVWDAEPPKGSSVLIFVRNQVLALGMMVVAGVLLLLTFLLNIAIAYVSSSAVRTLPFPHAGLVFAAANWLVSVLVIAVLFGLIFKYLPDVEIRWQDVGVGALCTALLFVLGQALIGIYIGKTAVGSAYGAAGALVAILVWVYYSAAILLLGAEFTKIYARAQSAEG